MSDLTSANHMAIQNAGYLVERDENKRTGITLRAKYEDEVIFSVTEADDELASSKLLALIKGAPRPGSPAATQAKRREVVTRPDLWTPVTPHNNKKEG
jgi:hypothetical protein